MKNEWWLRAAITDDHLVADLLLRLKDTTATSPSTSSLLLKPSWGTRQHRSKPSSNTSAVDKTRRSPTTPLWWSGGGGSPSEESSSLYLKLRSKISVASHTPINNSTTSKRPRRKKTFAELKEEESSLLKERICLKKELVTLSLSLKEQRSINENLKRIKLDFQAESRIKSEAISELDARNSSGDGSCVAASSSASRVKSEDASQHSCAAERGAILQEPVFMLPDLNMSPDEECGIVKMS